MINFAHIVIGGDCCSYNGIPRVLELGMRSIFAGMLLLCLGASMVQGVDSAFFEAEFEDLSLPTPHESRFQGRLTVGSYGADTYARIGDSRIFWHMTNGKGRKIRFDDGSLVGVIGSAYVSDHLLVRAFAIDKDDKPVGNQDFIGVYLLEGPTAKPLVDKDGKAFSGGRGIGGLQRRRSEYSSSPFFVRNASSKAEIILELCELNGLTVTVTPIPQDAVVRTDKILGGRPVVEWGKVDDATIGVFFEGKFQPLLDANKKPLRGNLWPVGDYLRSDTAAGTCLYYVKDATARTVDLGKDLKVESVFSAANVVYVAGTKGKAKVLFSLVEGKPKSIKLPRKLAEAPSVGKPISWSSYEEFAIAFIGNGDTVVDNTFQMTSDGIKELKIPAGKKVCNFGGALYPCNGHCAVLLCNSEDSHLDDDAARYVGTLNAKGEMTLLSDEPVKKKGERMEFSASADGIYCSFGDRDGNVKSSLYAPWSAG